MADTTEIDPDGDVMLVCGGEQQARSLRVSSAVLKRLSPVFKAMLDGGRFKEGIELRQTTRLELKLPDDDPAAMSMICHVLHFNFGNLLLDSHEVEHLLAVAQLADQYDLAQALQPAAEVWIRSALESKSVVRSDADRGCLLAVAYYFQHAKAFEMVATEIFMKSTSMVTDLKAWNTPCSEKLQHAFVFLYMQRSEALRVIGEAIDDVVATALIPYSGKADALCFRHCSYAEKHLATVMGHLQSQGLWPLSILRQHPLDTTIHKTRSALTSVDFSALSQCGAAVCIGGYLSPIDMMRRQLVVAAEEACKKVKKVSLDRTRAGKLLDP